MGMLVHKICPKPVSIARFYLKKYIFTQKSGPVKCKPPSIACCKLL